MRNRAAALIIKNGTLLLIRRQKPGQDYYILPGGGVELDESFDDACIREVKEETGLDVLGIQRVHTYNYRGSEEVYFLTRVPPDDPVLGGSEATRQSPANQYSFEWVTPEQLEGKNLQPPPGAQDLPGDITQAQRIIEKGKNCFWVDWGCLDRTARQPQLLE